MSLVDDVSGPECEQLAVLYCDISHADASGSVESEIALWRVNYFRAAGEVAADFGGHQTTTAAGGWTATFTSTVDALICARELSSLVGWLAGAPNLSGGLSAGTVTREPFGIAGSPVEEAIALCRRARPRQVLVADPLPVIVSARTDCSFAPAPRDVCATTCPSPSRRWGPATASRPPAGPAITAGCSDPPGGDRAARVHWPRSRPGAGGIRLPPEAGEGEGAKWRTDRWARSGTR